MWLHSLRGGTFAPQQPISMEETVNYFDKFVQLAWTYGPNALIAAALLIGGLWAIRRITRIFDLFLRQRNVDESLRPFFASLVDVGLKVVLLIVVAGRIGLETTSFIAVFSAIAFSVGLALQGSLGNFASGVLILLFRPYKVGDLLTVADKTGVVLEIQIFNTILRTPQNKRIIIPNGKMTEGPIENVAEKAEVRVDVRMDVQDDTPIQLLRSVSENVLRHCPYALDHKDPFVKIAGFGRDAMTAEIGCWVNGEHYVETGYYLYEELKKAFDAVGIIMAKEDFEEGSSANNKW
jgi:small conductance mechanosensitive channel